MRSRPCRFTDRRRLSRQRSSRETPRDASPCGPSAWRRRFAWTASSTTRVYTEVPSISDFVQQEPREGQPASEKTEIWVLFDERTFYLSAKCWDTEPDRIVAKEMRRGNSAVSRDDSITLTLDTFYDRRNGFYFQTSTLGAVYDALVTDERSENMDWDTVWETRSSRFEGGWSLEIAIPFKSLRYPRGGAQIWGINVRRTVPRNEELDYLSLVPASYGRVGIWKFSSAATLVGLETPEESLNLELKPYAISTLTTDRAATPAVSNDLSGDVGFDVKYGLTKGLIADFTYNTDFAQVEVDEQQVNLTRFSLFFPEKRPFFLEGQDIFAFGGAGPSFGGQNAGDTPIMFFSRQIGLSGGRAVPIVAGGRVTGRAGGYSVGLLNIQTDDDERAGAESTNFSVVRLKRNVFGRSTIGLLATHRSEAVASTGSNTAYGVDARFALVSTLFIDTYYARTKTRGQSGNDTSYRGRIENNGDRYGFQAEHLRVGARFQPGGRLPPPDGLPPLVRPAPLQPPPCLERFRPEIHVRDEPRLLPPRLDEHARVARRARGVRDSVRERRALAERYSRQFERLTEPFEIGEGVVVPAGGYTFQSVADQLQHRPAAPDCGERRVQAGSFFGGDLMEAELPAVACSFNAPGVEPGLSLDWVDLPEGRFTTKVVRARVIYTMTPRMFVEAMPQYSSASDSVTTNIRYRWEYQPGSDLFIVYTDGRDTRWRARFRAGEPRLCNQTHTVRAVLNQERREPLHYPLPSHAPVAQVDRAPAF